MWCKREKKDFFFLMDIDFNFFYKEIKVSVCLLYEVNMIFF